MAIGRPRRWCVALTLCIAVAASACGNRVSHRAVVAASSAEGIHDATSLGNQRRSVDIGVDSSGVGPNTERNGTESTAASGQGPAASPTSGRVSATGPRELPTLVPGRPAASEIRIGSVGTISGPVGATLLGNFQGLQVWQRYINDKGGLGGHPVRLSLADDGGDPTRHRVMIQQFVEQRHVVAFVSNSAPLTGRSSIEYLAAKRIPVIGGSTGEPYANDSPIVFPQATAGSALFYIFVASPGLRSLAAGKPKLGTLVCIESDTCTIADRVFGQAARSISMNRVYDGRSSLAQPDFTAECLAARNAGVQLLAPSLDANSVRRIAAACARQGYRVRFSIAASTIQEGHATDPNLQGAYGVENVFPWFQSGTPATDEFQAAMHRYGIAPSSAIATGWTSAKLFEKAASQLGERPSAEDILRGLWSLRNDTLGGLTRPLTFIKDKPTARNPVCWFDLEIRDKKWASADGFKLHCQDVPEATLK